LTGEKRASRRFDEDFDLAADAAPSTPQDLEAAEC
jgi:hypothetical protein